MRGGVFPTDSHCGGFGRCTMLRRRNGVPAPMTARPAALLAALALTPALTNAQQAAPKSDEKVAPRVFLSVDKLPAGGTCDVAVLLEVESGWHVYTQAPKEDYQVPTKLTITSKNGTKLKQTLYPAGKTMEFFGQKIDVFEGRALLFATVEVPASAAGSTEELQFTVEYQACSDSGNCLPPTKSSRPGKIAVAARGETPTPVNEKIFAMKPRIAATGSVVR